MSDPSASMLNKATIEKAQGNEISNSARDMFKFVQNNYNLNMEGENRVESHDAIGFLLNAVPPFLEEVRKNDNSRSTVSETSGADGSDPLPQAVSTDYTPQSSIPEGDLVDISDIMPADPSSLPVSSIADRYTRSMLKCLVGYPLYDPKPFSDLSKEYPLKGVNVGDVGFVRGNGTFDFLFNICPPHNDLINPPKLSKGFSLETPDHSVTRDLEPLPPNTCLFQSPITRTNSGEYICEASEGAVLELPEGAIEEEAVFIRPFEKLAARNGVQWYEYAMTRGRKISNGSLYLITSFTKCAQWGIAVFDRKCTPGQGLRFNKKMSLPFGKSTSKYHWKGSRAFLTKVTNPKQGNASNQCVFLRGYKIMIRQDMFDNLYNDRPHESGLASSLQAGSYSSSTRVTRHRAWRIRGGGATDPNIGGGCPLTTKSTMTESEEVVRLDANFNSSLIHPSDLINAALLSQNLNAKVALTHDGVWCDLLRGNFPKLNYTTLIHIAQSYTSTVDEYGCVLLGKIPDSSNVLDESSCSIQGTETLALQEPSHTHSVRDPRKSDIPMMPTQADTILPQQYHYSEAGDEGKPGISILPQALPTDVRSSEAGDEGKPGISVLSQAPHSTVKLTERDAQSWETDSKPSIEVLPTDGHSSEAGDEGKSGISAPLQALPPTAELPRPGESPSNFFWRTRRPIAPPSVSHSSEARDESKAGIFVPSQAAPSIVEPLRPPSMFSYYTRHPYPAYPYPPTPASSSTRSSPKYSELSSAPRDRGLGGLHAMLSATSTVVPYNVKLHPRTVIPDAYQTVGTQPMLAYSTTPTQIRVISRAFPWIIKIQGSQTLAVTCKDVWTSLYDQLQQPITEDDWAHIAHDESLRRAIIIKAYEKRVIPEDRLTSPIRRVDYLGDSTLFIGLQEDYAYVQNMLMPGTKKVQDTWVARFAKSAEPNLFGI